MRRKNILAMLTSAIVITTMGAMAIFSDSKIVSTIIHAGKHSVKIDKDKTGFLTNDTFKPGSKNKYKLTINGDIMEDSNVKITFDMKDKKDEILKENGIEPSLTDEVDIYYKGNKVEDSITVPITKGINEVEIEVVLKDKGSSELYYDREMDFNLSIQSTLKDTSWTSKDKHSDGFEYGGFYDTPIIIDPLEKEIIGYVPEIKDELVIVDDFNSSKFNPRDREINSIGDGAFVDSPITELTLDSPIKNVGNNAFDNSPICVLTVKDGVEKIAENAFDNLDRSNCPGGKSTIHYNYDEDRGDKVVDGNHYVGGGFFDKDKWHFDSGLEMFIYSKNNDGTYSVDGFNPEYFEVLGIDKPKSLNLPKEYNGKKVTSVGDNAFEGENLVSVNFPDDINSIGKGAFKNNNITNVEIPSKVTEIKDDVFASNKIEEIHIHKNIVKLGNNSFRDNNLTGLTIHDNIKEIGSGTFHDNPGGIVKAELLGDDFIKGPKLKAPNLRGGQFSEVWEMELDLYTYTKVPGGYGITGFNQIYIDKVLDGVQPVHLVLSSSHKGEPVVSVEQAAFQEKGIETLDTGLTVHTLKRRSFHDNKFTEVTLRDPLVRHEYISTTGAKDPEVGFVLNIGSRIASLGGDSYTSDIYSVDDKMSINMLGADKENFGYGESSPGIIPHEISKVVVKGDNPNFTVADNGNYLLSRNSNKLVFGGRNTKGSLPNVELKSIGPRAFYDMEIDFAHKNNELIIPEGVVEIGSSVYKDAKNLHTVTLPKSIKRIDSYAFHNTEISTLNINENYPEVMGIQSFGLTYLVGDNPEGEGIVYHNERADSDECAITYVPRPQASATEEEFEEYYNQIYENIKTQSECTSSALDMKVYYSGAFGSITRRSGKGYGEGRSRNEDLSIFSSSPKGGQYNPYANFNTKFTVEPLDELRYYNRWMGLNLEKPFEIHMSDTTDGTYITRLGSISPSYGYHPTALHVPHEYTNMTLYRYSDFDDKPIDERVKELIKIKSPETIRKAVGVSTKSFESGELWRFGPPKHTLSTLTFSEGIEKVDFTPETLLNSNMGSKKISGEVEIIVIPNSIKELLGDASEDFENNRERYVIAEQRLEGDTDTKIRGLKVPENWHIIYESDNPDSKFNYIEREDGTIKLISHNGLYYKNRGTEPSRNELIIPDEVDGKKVTALTRNGFPINASYLEGNETFDVYVNAEQLDEGYLKTNSDFEPSRGSDNGRINIHIGANVKKLPAFLNPSNYYDRNSSDIRVYIHDTHEFSEDSSSYYVAGAKLDKNYYNVIVKD